MKSKSNQSGRVAACRPGFVSGWLFSSAFLGLVIGLVEAARLWTTPRVIPLLVPDVGWGIWFLAPLVDMIFFGMVGLTLGWLASAVGGKEVFAALEAALAVTFVTLMLAWFHRGIGLHPFYFDLEVSFPMLVFAIGFTVALPIIAATWRHVIAFSEKWIRLLIKPLACGLGAATVVELVGIGVFVLWPPISGPAAPSSVTPPPGAPNIVFIVLDTVRADHLSSYGYSRPTTPNLDRFARKGVLFENAIAPAPWTLPSHASMFTGLLPQQHGAGWAVPLASRPWTLAEILRSDGYKTAGFAANMGYLQKGWGIAQGFETYDDCSSWIRTNLIETLLGNAIVQPLYQTFRRYDWFHRRSAQHINAAVFRWFQHRTQRPFFLFINYLDAHDPYVTFGAYNHRFGKLPKDLDRRLNFYAEHEGDVNGFSPQERTLLVDGYDNCLSYLDNQVGRLLTFLRRSPEWQNTIVIITSDHGEEFGKHGSYVHGNDLYRELLHVPLIIAGPGLPQDLRISHLVGTRQLFSTVLDLTGRGHTPFSRTSLARFWRPGFESTPFDDTVVSELSPYVGQGGERGMISLTTPQWEFIEHRDGKQELYDWAKDPDESNNLASAPPEQATLAKLRNRLVNLVSTATGPWYGTPYLQALDGVQGPSRLSLLFPQPLQPLAQDNPFRIGTAQAYFKPQESTPVPPTRPERELMQSLPYQ